VKVADIMQDNLSIYVFSIDISFKGCQSLSNMRSKVPSVTNLHNFVDYIREFEAIFEKALICVSGTQGKLFDEKTQRSKISCQGPFKASCCVANWIKTPNLHKIPYTIL
jgi:hypothetical protein